MFAWSEEDASTLPGADLSACVGAPPQGALWLDSIQVLASASGSVIRRESLASPGAVLEARSRVETPGSLLCQGEAPCLALGHPESLRPFQNLARPDGPRPRLTGTQRLLVLDIDGVLIDPGRSFQEAVARTLQEWMPEQPWSDAHFDAFKHLGGFNNDFRLAAAAKALGERGQLDRLWTAGFEGFPDLEPRFQELEPEAQRRVQRHYQDTLHLERPLISLAELEALPCSVALLTGRPPEELTLAHAVLGFTLPGLSDSGPHLRKPEPAGLIQLAEAFSAGRVLFVGDTRDDGLCLQRARALHPECSWRFAAVGAERSRLAELSDLEAPSLQALLPRLKQEAFWDDEKGL